MPLLEISKIKLIRVPLSFLFWRWLNEMMCITYVHARLTVLMVVALLPLSSSDTSVPSIMERKSALA